MNIIDKVVISNDMPSYDRIWIHQVDGEYIALFYTPYGWKTISSNKDVNNEEADSFENFDPATQYHINDIVRRDGALYRFTANHIGPWDKNKVVLTSVYDELDRIKANKDELAVIFNEDKTAAHTTVGNTQSIGANSFAEGSNTIASGISSHAEGADSVASGVNSHTEGTKTVASGISSHAEGGVVFEVEAAKVDSVRYKQPMLLTSAKNSILTTIMIEDFYGSRDLTVNDTLIGYHCEMPSGELFDVVFENECEIVSIDKIELEEKEITALTVSCPTNTERYGIMQCEEGIDDSDPAPGYYFKMYRKTSSGSVASGENAHAEGGYTIASGYNAHSEGDTTVASGRGSHTEGGFNEASGKYSHAEGSNNTASGDNSSASGYNTEATGFASSTAGYYTIAYNRGEAAFGQYNSVSNASQLFSIGIGTGESDRRNAVTVDKYGNVEFSEDITVNGTSFQELVEQVNNLLVYLTALTTAVETIDTTTAAALNELNDTINEISEEVE